MYLAAGTEQVFAVFHQPASATVIDRALILCPPFGWTEVCAYRSLRSWASWLAGSGFGVLRLSFPATGDSGGGPRQPGQLDAWTAAIAAGVEWLRASIGAVRVGAVGLELGGMVACRAAAGSAEIDDLVLWATPSRGRGLIRRLRAISQVEQEMFYPGLPAPPASEAGELETGGFRLSGETQGDLQRLDLTELPLASSRVKRALLLGGDRSQPDPRLEPALTTAGVLVDLDSGDGYEDMTSHPQTARPAWPVIEVIARWLTAGSLDDVRHSRPGMESRGEPTSVITLGEGRGAFTEQAVTIEHGFGELSGVLAEPVTPTQPDLYLVMLNAGAVRRIGPNRMWVEMSRRWAQRGVASFRLDLEGIGEADGDGTPYAHDRGLYVESLTEQVMSALDWLSTRSGAERFVLVGLCSGAYWAFHGAINDQRVQAAFMINPRVLVWDEAVLPARDFRAFWTRPVSPRRLVRIARSRRVRAVWGWMLRRLLNSVRPRPRGSTVSTPAETDELLERMRCSPARFSFLFADGEPLLAELRESGELARITAWPNVTLRHIKVRDHTLRPIWAQQAAHAEFDGLLTELTRSDGEAEPGQPSR